MIISPEYSVALKNMYKYLSAYPTDTIVVNVVKEILKCNSQDDRERVAQQHCIKEFGRLKEYERQMNAGRSIQASALLTLAMKVPNYEQESFLRSIDGLTWLPFYTWLKLTNVIKELGIL